MTGTYFVVFTKDREDDLNFSLEDQFAVFRIRNAENAKDARHKAWKAVHGRKGNRWLVRNGWSIWNTGLVEEAWPPGIRRGEWYTV